MPQNSSSTAVQPLTQTSGTKEMYAINPVTIKTDLIVLPTKINYKDKNQIVFIHKCHDCSCDLLEDDEKFENDEGQHGLAYG